jgi:hypothetical protein
VQRRFRDLSRACLPLVPLCFCSGSGSGNVSALAATPAAIRMHAFNAPPVIVLAAGADAQVGATFEYQPVARDPESDTLRFAAINLPPWASLDPTSGRITGTPGPDDAGLYESISITVADATHKVVTPPFSITVNPALEPASGVASLRWEIPSSKVGGEPLDDLAGYRILYGRSSSDLDHSVLIMDPAVTSYQFSKLTSGVWYFAVVAVSSNGLEGPPTTFASKSI